MSRQEADIIKGLKAIAASVPLLLPGKVKEVDTGKMTCEVCDVDGFIWHDVRLQALVPAGKGMLLIPEKDSDVIIGRIDNEDCFCVLLYSRIADVYLNISGRYVIVNEAENWFELMGDLLDILSEAVISTPAGPGNFAPQVVRQLGGIKMRFEKLFKKE